MHESAEMSLPAKACACKGKGWPDAIHLRLIISRTLAYCSAAGRQIVWMTDIATVKHKQFQP